jgi:hypothetical protein
LFPDFEEEFPKKEEEVPSFSLESKPVVEISDEDAPLTEMTLKDFAAIMLMKPVSKRAWLNELILKSKDL